jgi:hypothetical protein
MTTLFDTLLKTAECLRGLRYSTSTAVGSTTTLVDTTRIEIDDYFVKGTLFIQSGALANKSLVITDWTLASGAFLFTAQTAAPGSGISYAVGDRRWPRDAMVAALNLALHNLGTMSQVIDNGTFILVKDQTEYSLPTGVSNIARVQFATETASPYEWSEPYHRWRELNGKLYLDEDDLIWLNSYAGCRIRIYYNAIHPTVGGDTDAISDAVNMMRLAWEAAYYACLVKSDYDPKARELLPLADKERQAHPKFTIEQMPRDPRFSGW